MRTSTFVSYLSQLGGRISLGVRNFEWVELRQHHLPLLVVDEDHLLLLLLLFFITSSLSIILLNLLVLLFSLPLNCSSICSGGQNKFIISS